MDCFFHIGREAGATCISCGKPVCLECKVMLANRYYCNPCADEIISGNVENSIVNKASTRNLTSITSTDFMRLNRVNKTRAITGQYVQVIGWLIFIGSGLAVFIWELNVLFNAFGAWAILIALFLAPITYLAAIFIVWFSTGVFPVIVLILWLLSWAGLGITNIGSRLKGED